MKDHERNLQDFATLDHEREARQGFPEVIFAERKTPFEVAAIAQHLYKSSGKLLATRASAAHYEEVLKHIPSADYNEIGRAIAVYPNPETVAQHLRSARIAIISAGTSDGYVAEEAIATLQVAGVGRIDRIADVGVAGIHRLLARTEDFHKAHIIIVCAGMEGALPSVVGGLVKVPVIAVPTSVGYGASFGGLAALLGMLNSCASGLSVVNIDNGFGAAMAALRIFSLRASE